MSVEATSRAIDRLTRAVITGCDSVRLLLYWGALNRGSMCRNTDNSVHAPVARGSSLEQEGSRDVWRTSQVVVIFACDYHNSITIRIPNTHTHTHQIAFRLLAVRVPWTECTDCCLRERNQKRKGSTLHLYCLYSQPLVYRNSK